MKPSAPASPAKAQSNPVPPIDRAAALGLDLSGLREALPFYKAGDLTNGDAEAAAATDPIVRTTLEWVALRNARDVGTQRLQAFHDPHRRGRRAMSSRIASRKSSMRVSTPTPRLSRAIFRIRRRRPRSASWRLPALSASEGKTAEAQDLVRTVWRKADLTGGSEIKVKTEFGAYLTTADHKARADRLLYEEENEAGLRAAALAGPDVLALAKLRVAMSDEVATDKMFAAIPAAMQSDPAYLLAKVQKLRRAAKVTEAAALMLTAPRDPALLIDGDAWWIERRMIARKLLDLNDPATAYRICAENSAESDEAKIDAEFHAGWIALRFLNDPARAAKHFDAAALIAQTPISIARIAYWQGRTAEISQSENASELAEAFYEKAAERVSTYYGQLARERLQLPPIKLRSLGPAATGKARDESRPHRRIALCA